MIFLDALTKSLDLALSSAVATNELEFNVSYVDIDQATSAALAFSANDGVSTGTTAATLLAGAASGVSRQLKYCSVYNADTVSATVTISYDNNGTVRDLFSVLLVAGASLQYTQDKGWFIAETNLTFDPSSPPPIGDDTPNSLAGTSLVLAGNQISPELNNENYLINGDFRIWERGIAFATPANGNYVADRFYVAIGGATVSNVSRVASTVPGSTYALRMDYTGAICQIIQWMEGLGTSLAGVEITVSCMARGDGTARFQTVDGVGGVNGDVETLTGTAIKMTMTTTIRAGAADFRAAVIALTGTFIELTQFKVELGDIATLFEARPIAEERAICKRYYEKLTYNNTNVICTGQAFSAVLFSGSFDFVEKRITPSISHTGNIAVWTAVGSSAFSGTVPVVRISTTSASLEDSTATGLVAGDACGIHCAGVVSIEIDAEI